MFSHYPTHVLSDDTSFNVTALGTELVNNQNLIPWHYEKEHVFREINTAMKIVEFYSEQSSFLMKDVLQLSSICGSATLKKRAIMWLLKHGFLELDRLGFDETSQSYFG